MSVGRTYCCTFCKGPYYTQLRDALYCAACLERHVSRKFRKSMGELPRKGDVLVVVEESMHSVVMVHILGRLVSKASARTMHYFVVSQNAVVPRFRLGALASFSCTSKCSRGSVLDNETRKAVFNVAKEGGFVGILVAEPLENVARHSIASLLRGEGREAVLAACTQNLCGIPMVNVLSQIPKRGVCGYFFLYRKELPFFRESKEHTSLLACVERLLESTRLRNSGAHNSFVEALRKVGTQGFYFCPTCCLYHRAQRALCDA